MVHFVGWINSCSEWWCSIANCSILRMSRWGTCTLVIGESPWKLSFFGILLIDVGQSESKQPGLVMGLPNGPERILQVVSMSTPGPGVSEVRISGCITAAQINLEWDSHCLWLYSPERELEVLSHRFQCSLTGILATFNSFIVFYIMDQRLLHLEFQPHGFGRLFSAYHWIHGFQSLERWCQRLFKVSNELPTGAWPRVTAPRGRSCGISSVGGVPSGVGDLRFFWCLKLFLGLKVRPLPQNMQVSVGKTMIKQGMEWGI